MVNAQKIGRDDWIRTSDPLNPIHRTQSEPSDSSDKRSIYQGYSQRANLEADYGPRWTPILPLALAIFALLVFLNWNGFLWIRDTLEHAAAAVAGPWG